MIEVKGLSKRYGRQQVLAQLSFTVQAGSLTALMGKNGSGKSTLLSLMAGMLAPDEGEILYDGQSISNSPRPGRAIGYVAQGDCLFDELSVRDNLSFWASAMGLGRSALSNNSFVALLGVDSFLSKRVARLSGGMRRRVAICAALLGDPAYLLLDEPFTGLDLIYKRDLCDSLLRLGAMGKTMLYTTHSGEEVADLSNHALVLAGGKIIFSAPTKELLDKGQSIQSTLIHLIEGDSHDE